MFKSLPVWDLRRFVYPHTFSTNGTPIRLIDRNNLNIIGNFRMQIVLSWGADFKQKVYYRPLKTLLKCLLFWLFLVKICLWFALVSMHIWSNKSHNIKQAITRNKDFVSKVCQVMAPGSPACQAVVVTRLSFCPIAHCYWYTDGHNGEGQSSHVLVFCVNLELWGIIVFTFKTPSYVCYRCI